MCKEQEAGFVRPQITDHGRTARTARTAVTHLYKADACFCTEIEKS